MLELCLRVMTISEKYIEEEFSSLFSFYQVIIKKSGAHIPPMGGDMECKTF